MICQKEKKSLGLELRLYNSETFLGIFAIQDVDRSTKPVDVDWSCRYIFIGNLVTSVA